MQACLERLVRRLRGGLKMMYGTAPMPGVVANASQSMRMAFVRKVYGLFFVSILISVFTGWQSIQPGMLEFSIDHNMMLWLAGFGLILAMGWGKRMQGLNLLLLYIFSAIMGFVVGPYFYMWEHFAPGLPAQAGALTTAVFGGLTLYVMLTRQDFNFLGGFLCVGLIALIVAGLMMSLFHIAALTTVYSVVGVLIFSGYVLYDTSRIMTRLSLDQAPIGALELYLDFLNLLMLIMSLMGGGRRR